MSELILTVMVGVSGSGKSTYSNGLVEKLNAIKVETDKIRHELTGSESDQSKNSKVFYLANQRIRKHLSEGKNVIFDATNLSVKDRKDYVRISKEYGAKLHAYVIKPDISVSKSRNFSRDRKVPEDVIDRQFSKFVLPSKEEGFDFIQVIEN